MSKVTLKCSDCGRALAWQVPGEDYSICSSDYREGLDICYSCLIEHCCNTNCYSCRRGKYPECEWLETKKHYMAKDD